MEFIWKCWKLSIALLFLCLEFCEGFPLNLGDNISENTQFLTGLAAVLLTLGSVVLVGCLCCQRKKGFQEFHNTPVTVSVTTSDPGHVNPISNGEFTIFTPLQSPNLNNDLFLGNDQFINKNNKDYIYEGFNVEQWRDKAIEDFSRAKLKYIREIGTGRFGKVVEGAARYLDSDKLWTSVIVRILDAASSQRERVLFLNDALFYLAPLHPNLLALKGQCINSAPLLLLQEFCSGGDLKGRLRFKGNEDKTLQWCCQLTSALNHLHDHGFVHPDLAARNCLLTDNLALKLGDYGLNVTKYPEDYYKGGEPLISVRWRSPESLECTATTIRPRKMTKEANIWALGVVMWEICENGMQPYSGLDDDEVISKVFGTESLRLVGPSKPELYSDYIFRLIKMCWNTIESRPKINQINMMLMDLLQVDKHSAEPLINSDFEQRWESFKPNTVVKTDNVFIDMEGISEQNISKPLSPSLNNLHGSLDNLSSLPFNVNNNKSTQGNSKRELSFELGALSLNRSDKFLDSPIPNDSLTDSLIFKQAGSSGSDTEEENWRRKVERGAYSEKVRLKSKSVADLMILTHVDYPESETETPMTSIDYRTNKNCRKSNLESSSLNFSSEGNLLNLEDNFEQELKKLQVERRDSLLYVPENKRDQINSNISLLQEFNSPTEMKPINHIYSIFNMAIDKYEPVRLSGSKLHDIINLSDDKLFSRQNSENKSDLGYATLHNSERNSDFGSVDGEQLLDDGNVKLEIEEKLKNCNTSDSESPKKHNLPDILASIDQDHAQLNLDLLESNNSILTHNDDDDSEMSSLEHDELEEESQKRIPKLSDLVLNNRELMRIINESEKVPDLCSENVQCSSDSIKLNVNSDLNLNKTEVFTDNLLPEIKQKFIRGPSIKDSINLNEISKNSEQVNGDAIECIETNQQQLFDIEYFLNKERQGYLDNPKVDEFLCEERKLNNCDLNNSGSNDLENVNNNSDLTTIVDGDFSTKYAYIQEFINAETTLHFEQTLKNFSDGNIDQLEARVTFDLSENQEESKPNLLSHTLAFSSTPFTKKSITSLNQPTSLNLFNSQEDEEESNMFSSIFLPLEEVGKNAEENKLNYSLETWDNFLGKTFDINRNNDDNFFDSFTSEPGNIALTEELNQSPKVEADKTFVKNLPNETASTTFVKNEEENSEGTFIIDGKNNKTFLVEEQQEENDDRVENIVENSVEQWDKSGGWFLHPQSENATLNGEMEPQPSTSKGSSYIRFGMDDEIMTALRNELLEKLPQAQNASSQENVTEDEPWNHTERNEVFLKYNVYNTPLSPIPEENSFDIEEDLILEKSLKLTTDSDSEEWSDQSDFPVPVSSRTNEAAAPNAGPESSQSSCCSNDTLFNCDDIATTVEKEIVESPDEVFFSVVEDNDEDETLMNNNSSNEKDNNSEVTVDEQNDSDNKELLDEFLNQERNHSSTSSLLVFSNKLIAPLPSPDSKPWKSLPVSFLTQELYGNNTEKLYENETAPSGNYVNVDEHGKTENLYENDFNEGEYENINDLVKSSSTLCDNNSSEYVNANVVEQKDDDMLGILTDIRFSGPIDNQLMSTSFSESNDVEEQDWESGSDTRSSSSGEFIWKEGEHEESLKALKAAPNDALEDIQPMEQIIEQISECDANSSSDDDDDDDCENMEFVPSAWDKFAAPTKSALRSPEKCLEKAELKKSKGVWFKKQKYHCVYEYPREPESPILHSQDLWKPSEIDYDAFSGSSKILNEDFTTLPTRSSSSSSSSSNSQFFPGAPLWMENITPDSGLEDYTPETNDLLAKFKEVLTLKQIASNAVNRNKEFNKGPKDSLGGLRHTRNKLKLNLPPSPSAFTSSKTFAMEPAQEPIILREKPAFSTFGKSRFLVQHVETPDDDAKKNVCFDVLPYKPFDILNLPTVVDSSHSEEKVITLEPLENGDLSQVLKFSDAKLDLFTRGEANLLDSADEDSGIESSTLERKNINFIEK